MIGLFAFLLSSDVSFFFRLANFSTIFSGIAIGACLVIGEDILADDRCFVADEGCLVADVVVVVDEDRNFPIDAFCSDLEVEM